jgi:type II secretory pathway pseudopilin PulG
MFNIFKNKRKGTTLVEVLVVIGLMGISLSVVVGSLPTIQTGANASATLDGLVADIKAQQQKAMFGDNSGSGISTHYGIKFTGNSYNLFKGANTVNPVWTRQFGTTGNDVGYGTTTDSSGNVYTSGYTSGSLPGFTNPSPPGYDAFLRKYDSDGTEIWTRQFGTTGTDNAYDVITDASGNVYIAGYTSGVLPGQTGAGGSYDTYLRKYNSAGTELWTQQFGTTGADFPQRMALDSSGNIYILGDTTGAFATFTNLGLKDVYLRKYNSSGVVQWTQQFGTSAAGDETPRSIALDTSGNVYIAGYTTGSLPTFTVSGTTDAFWRKYDSTGAVLLTVQYGASTGSIDYGNGIAVDTSGNIYASGMTDGTWATQSNVGAFDAYFVKYNSAGVQQLVRQYGTTSTENILNIELDSLGNIYTSGYGTGVWSGQLSSGGLRDGFIVKHNSAGTLQWNRQFGSSGEDYVLTSALNTDTYSVVIGNVSAAMPGQTLYGLTDVFICKLENATGGGCASVLPTPTSSLSEQAISLSGSTVTNIDLPNNEILFSTRTGEVLNYDNLRNTITLKSNVLNKTTILQINKYGAITR